VGNGRRWAYVLAFFGCMLPAVCGAQPTTSQNTLFKADVASKLTTEIVAIVKKNNLPSAAVGIFVPGKGRYLLATGYANLKTKLARNAQQPFRIASVTKPFASTAILVLVDRGLLKVSDPIAKWYPDFPNAKLITVDDLLRMRSGIPAPNDDEVLAKVYDAPLAAAPPLPAEMASFAKLKAQFKPPNTVGVYTDFNYDVLAGIVHTITGKDIGEVIKETIVDPLKLHNTSYPTGDTIPGDLRGYGWNATTKQFDDKTLFNPPLAGAAGAVVSNIFDLDTFSRAVCDGTLLKAATHKAQMNGALLEGSQTKYGEGIATGNGVCGHSGTINGFIRQEPRWPPAYPRRPASYTTRRDTIFEDAKWGSYSARVRSTERPWRTEQTA
jgi:D-alanyl-D-alanine carboxypeptidase